jgi:hypothetical protein
MEVSTLLSLMGNLSLGNDNITQVERAIFLQYLNLANLELYQITANFNQDLLVQVTLANQVDSNQVQLPETPYLVNSVYDLTHQRQLRRISLSDAITKDPAFTANGNPTQYFVKRDVLEFVPTQTTITSIKIWYVPQPIILAENTPEQDIPYPLAYHPVLVDGALYYLFQEEGGFKNLQKAQAAQARWEIGQTRLLAYLYNSSGQLFSTFSSV